MADVATRMLKGGMWIAGARAVTNGLGFLSTILLARLLVPDDFGLVALATSILAIVNAVTALPVSEALIQHRKPTTDHFHTAWSIGVARAVLVALVMAASARPAALIYSDPRLEVVIYAFAFGVALSGLGNPRRIMLNRDLVFWQDALLSVGQKLAMIVVSLLIAWEYKSYWALILGSLAGQVAYVLLSYTALPFLPRITFKHTRDLLSFSVWLSLGQIINTINWRFDQLLIGGLSGRAALGYYSVGDNLAQLPTREAIAPLTQPLYPAFSRVADDHERLRAGYQRAQAFITAVALPIGVGFALLASPLILHFMGEKWAPAVIVAQGLSAIFALQTLGSLAQPLGMAAGATKLLFKRDVQMFFVRLPIITAGNLAGGTAWPGRRPGTDRGDRHSGQHDLGPRPDRAQRSNTVGGESQKSCFSGSHGSWGNHAAMDVARNGRSAPVLHQHGPDNRFRCHPLYREHGDPMAFCRPAPWSRG